MKISLLSVYDKQIQAYGAIFTARTIGEAIRGLTDHVADKTTEIAKHPEDYQLFKLGEWDNETGKIYPTETPMMIISAEELVK